jgi:hypothetical protein
MKKLLFGLAAVALLGLGTMTGTADAAPSHGHRGGYHGGYHGGYRGAYYTHYGVRFSGGYYFRGYDHHHWGRRVWDPVHCRWNYWEPNLQVYYYWYAPGSCYYPVSYCP